MKTYIWIKNTENTLFEIYNTNDGLLDVAASQNHELLKCNPQDLIHYAPNIRSLPGTERLYYEVVHCSSSFEETAYIKSYILGRLQEKSDLLRQRQTLKKMKSPHVQFAIDDINKQLRHQYHEISITDILHEYKKTT